MKFIVVYYSSQIDFHHHVDLMTSIMTHSRNQIQESEFELRNSGIPESNPNDLSIN